MTPAEYDAWYDTRRGQWIGMTEYRLMLRHLAPRAGEHLLDAGCGTGWFTRKVSAIPGVTVTGIDIDDAALAFARSRDARSHYLVADACQLPWADASFDGVFSITALGFMHDWKRGLAEMVRVSRKRLVIGMLHRHSLLWRSKGREGGVGAYQGAHWHSIDEVRAELDRLDVRNIRFDSAIYLASGGLVARALETCLASFSRGGSSHPVFPYGSFLLVSADR